MLPVSAITPSPVTVALILSAVIYPAKAKFLTITSKKPAISTFASLLCIYCSSAFILPDLAVIFPSWRNNFSDNKSNCVTSSFPSACTYNISLA